MPLNIVVVGGAAGGIAAAVRCRRLDERASIKVIEKGPYVSYANSGVPYALGGIIETDTALILQTPAGLKARFNLDVRIHSELLSIEKQEHTITVRSLERHQVYKPPYDKLVLAQGADPAFPEIDGIANASNVFTLQTPSDLKPIQSYITKNESKCATVLGGGYIGVKAVESLRSLGLKVDLIDINDHIYPAFDKDISNFLQKELQRNKVQLYLEATVQKIVNVDVEDRYYIQLQDGSNIPADIIIVAVGFNPRVDVARNAGLAVRRGVTVNAFMQTSDPDMYAVGDMAETEHRIEHRPRILALVGPASRQGRLAADHIYNKSSPYQGNVGTSISKVFHLTAAITGLSVHELRHMGYNPQWVTVHTPDHEGYYPSSSQLTLHVSFDPYTGRLLGAQAVGRSGVDKRIDVLSTALQAGMSIFDLEQLELSYAPQYGTAKDPVNQAGCVAGNVLRGNVKVVHPEEFIDRLQEWQIIDVRTAEAFSQGHIVTSRNIPLDSMRYNLAGIDKELPVLVYSRVGYHSYIACRILEQLGYQVSNIDGVGNC